MRIWSGRDDDHGSIAFLGNGNMGVYEQGPDVNQVVGPPYSAPCFVRMPMQTVAKVQSERSPGTAIWTHSVAAETGSATMTDFVDADVNCFVRRIEGSMPLRFAVLTDPDIRRAEMPGRYPGAKWCTFFFCERGRPVFNLYPSPLRHYVMLTVSGDVEVRRTDAGYELTIGPGAGEIRISGGPGYPECAEAMAKSLCDGFARALERTQAYWSEFTGRRRDFSAMLDGDFPNREAILAAIDDTAVTLKVQQGRCGGVLAGHCYLWCAMRDQSGVFRGLMSLGCHKEARAILEYMAHIFRTRGTIHNGQDIGLEGFFHIHENDDVEQTGFLLHMAMEYSETTGDIAILGEMFPMLRWAFEAQAKHVRNHMLPFNGDETYIAGGVLPRSVLNDGSFEATMLFVVSGERFLRATKADKRWDSEAWEKHWEVLQGVRSAFRANFLHEGKIRTNNPNRLQGEEPPRYRHGVCEVGFEDCLDKSYTVVPTERDAYGRYVCPLCLAHGLTPPKPEETEFFVQSVSLVPRYLRSDLLSDADIRPVVQGLWETIQATGKVVSRIGAVNTVGYDYGLLLMSLDALEMDGADEMLRLMLEARDDTGVWVEYYDEGGPKGCRYRPYESGINLDAIVRYIDKRAK